MVKLVGGPTNICNYMTKDEDKDMTYCKPCTAR